MLLSLAALPVLCLVFPHTALPTVEWWGKETGSPAQVRKHMHSLFLSNVLFFLLITYILACFFSPLLNNVYCPFCYSVSQGVNTRSDRAGMEHISLYYLQLSVPACLPSHHLAMSVVQPNLFSTGYGFRVP